MTNLLLTTANGTPLPSTVNVDALGAGLYVQASLDGVLTSVYWTLTFAGGQVVTPKTTFGRKNAQPYFGTLQGFTSTATLLSSISVGPQLSTVYLPPPTQLVSNTVHATLTATTLSGFQRSIQIRVEALNSNEWA